MGAGCSTASVFIQMDEIVAIARSNRIEEALLKEEVVNFILQNNYIEPVFLVLRVGVTS